eukprot:Tbor_TRINITY_DN5148_c0_g4::TRINITY_DN5148_c0_g4_i1::g.25784::m.25784/K02154/ATPeV0A, ATP6N; V-type H+-transporting ATPase subunit a
MPREAASGLWRSEDMKLVQLHMQREAAHHSVLYLGRLGMFEFKDLNKHISAFQRDFAGQVRRCEDMERRLRYILDEISKSQVKSDTITIGHRNEEEEDSLNTLERKIEKHEEELRDLNTQFEALVNQRNCTREHLEVLSRDLGYTLGSSGGLTLLSGVIPSDKIVTFERLIYRATRGNSILRTEEITEPFYNMNTNESVTKCVFAIFFSASRLTDKLRKICEINGASLYNSAESQSRLIAMRSALRQQSEALAHTLKNTANCRYQLLASMADSAPEWQRSVATEKAVFTILNQVQYQGATVVAVGWVPASELHNIRAVLRDAEVAAGASVATIINEIPTKETHPTYFKTNKITSTFQGIVDSYGIARYKEVNPGVFTIITFPYLFGIMYGDIGHGLILTLFAAFLIFMEKSWEGKPLNEIFQMIFGGRYLLLLMGLFATYIGVLYNDMFGFSTEIFTSGYTWPELPPKGPRGLVRPLSPNGNPSVKPISPVIFGIDGAWSETENKLELYNSIKMKCAIIIGIVQMLAGVFISLLNHIYFKDWNNVWFRFIPEVIFLTCTFGYMAILIIVKWLTVWENTHDAPSLLETMTNFFLQPGSVNKPLYSGQASVQVILLVIAFSMVPLLLFMIPYLENKHHKEKIKMKLRHHNSVEG